MSDGLLMVNVKSSAMRCNPVMFIVGDVSKEYTDSLFSVGEYSTVDIVTNIQGVTARMPRYLRAVTLFHST
jgi:hypothetical protein